MVWRSLSDIAFSEVKQLLVASWDQLGENDSEYDSKVLQSFKTVKWNKKNVVVLKCKNRGFFLRKLTETSNLILCFSEIPKIVICFRIRQVAFLSDHWTKVVRLKKYLFYGFRFSISPWLYKCVKGKHIENRRDQTCLSFSTRSAR